MGLIHTHQCVQDIARPTYAIIESLCSTFLLKVSVRTVLNDSGSIPTKSQRIKWSTLFLNSEIRSFAEDGSSSQAGLASVSCEHGTNPNPACENRWCGSQ